MMTSSSRTHRDSCPASPPAQPGTLQQLEEARGSVLYVAGDWTLDNYHHLKSSVATVGGHKNWQVDFSRLCALDTAGAAVLAQFLGRQGLAALPAAPAGLPKAQWTLLQSVGATLDQPECPPTRPTSRLSDGLAVVGLIMVSQWHNTIALLNFMGLTLTTLAATLLHPRRWRITSLIAHLHQTGLNAVPIVALLTFLVGAVVAFLGATVLANFGATIYTVDLVVFAFLREFGVLLAAILLAGRTASAFTAQIGSMKVNEELDALRALGLDPIEMLVVPRVLALLINLPLLTFVAMFSGICGGALVAVFSLDIPLLRFISITQEIPLKHFLLGLVKAPLFAFLIALIGCLEGFKVQNNARSVGDHTTSSVVQSIFTVILLDAVAALFFMEMGW